MNLSKFRNMMNRRSSILLALLLMLYACQPKPRLILIKTGEIVDTSSNTAIVQGFIIDPGEGIIEHGHCWSTSSNPTFEAKGKTTLGSNSNSTFTSELLNLTPNSIYYIRAYATDGNTPPEYGEELKFRTNGIKPVAEFSASKTSVEVDELVKFTDLSSNNPTSWSWNYGDGGSDTEQNPSHAYSSEGTYTVKLIAANEFGSDTATKTNYIIVNKEVGPPPNAEFSASSTKITEGESVQFTDLSSNNPTSWSWNYGDGGSDTKQNPSHAYSSAGTYTVTLTASNEFGSDTETKTNFIIVEEEVGPPPTAAFSASSTKITEGESVQFTDLSGNDPTSWGWDFGDGSTSPEQNPSHAYSSAGTYTVTLTASNEFGSDTETKTNFINVDFPCGSVFTDPRDGETYGTVQIGNQCWMAENLKATRYSDGTVIPLVEGFSAWENLMESDVAYCFYDNNSSNQDTYGALYSWAAAMNDSGSSDANPSEVQGVCPAGWHLPSDAEWKELEIFLGMSVADADALYWRGTDQGAKLKEEGTTNWDSPNTDATNSSGFTALPRGYRNKTSNFEVDGYGAGFWTASENDASAAWIRYLNSPSKNVHRNANDKNYGFSVRCVKNE